MLIELINILLLMFNEIVIIHVLAAKTEVNALGRQSKRLRGALPVDPLPLPEKKRTKRKHETSTSDKYVRKY